MLSVSFYVFMLLTFFVMLSAAFYTSAKTISYLFQTPVKRLLFWSLVFNAVLIVFMVMVRNVSDSFYRLLLNYLGFISFGFFIALFYWLPQWGKRLTTGQWFRFSRSTSRNIAHVYIVVWASVVILAVYNFHKPDALVTFELKSDKVSKPVRFVHISDIQYGTTSLEEMNQKLEQVYALNPDFIVFTGDLVDFEGYRTEDFSVLANSPVPIYFERGNHEFYHDPTRLLSDLNRVDTLRMLINKKDSFGEIDIVGIDYGEREYHLAKHLLHIPLNKDRFSILLYHEPIDVDDGVAHGFDLLLFGHTHGGQIWPFTWVVDWIYPYADGFFKVGDSTIYTSDGLSLWGPRMRLGSQNEYVLFTISPTNEQLAISN